MLSFMTSLKKINAPSLNEIVASLKIRYKDEPEFLQAVEEVALSLMPLCEQIPQFAQVFKTLCEPERIVQFRVNWVDDQGILQTNVGYRVQFNSALGPYKGGLRFHPSVNRSILKFLGFEQTFKNALTGLGMGGGKGGADFDPKGKSEREIRTFCQAFMSQLAREIGPTRDVPAGDIGVGSREIGWMYGQYRATTQCFDGSLTGKGLLWGGSRLRPEATGYGAVYFANILLKDQGRLSGVANLRCALSGAGNAAQFCAQKLIEEGAHVHTLSDTSGTLLFSNGLTIDELTVIMTEKNLNRVSLHHLFSQGALPYAQFFAYQSPWKIAAAIDLAFPCATQNEINSSDVAALVAAGCKGVVEVANMPCSAQAIQALQMAGCWIAPSKAANAGGVAVSGLEMSQNASRTQWTAPQVDEQLQNIMKEIYFSAKEAQQQYHLNHLIHGANLAGFLKIAQSMIEQGLC